MANKKRGEFHIQLEGEDYTLQLTYEVMTEIEDALVVGVFELFSRAASGLFTLREMAKIVYLSIIKSDEFELSEIQIGQMILAAGVTKYIDPIGNFFTEAINGGAKREPLKKKVTKKK